MPTTRPRPHPLPSSHPAPRSLPSPLSRLRPLPRLLAAVGCVLLALLAPSTAPAQSAALLRGGERVFLAEADGETLDVDLRTGRCRPLDPEKLGMPLVFRPAAVSSSGLVIGTAGLAVYACDLKSRKSVRLYEAPTTASIEAVACNPKDGAVLVQLETVSEDDAGGGPADRQPATLICIPPDSAQAGPVFSRRVSSFQGLAFGQDGRLYFGTEGDLWAGTIDRDDPPEEGEPQRYILTAERIAAVATRETYLGTPVQMGVVEVAVDRTHLYFRLNRMGGSGWGELGRMKLLPDETRNEVGSGEADRSEMTRFARRMVGWLSSLESLGSCATHAFLCASPDGRHALYLLREDGGTLSEGTLVLYEDGKRKRRIRLAPGS